MERAMPPIPAQILQMAVAALGGALFHALGIPAAWLSGSVVAVVIWGALGQARPLPVPLVEAAMLISGASIGAAVTPEALAAMARYPSSLVVLAFGVVAISLASMLWLTLVARWRRADALLASAPGALSTVMAVAIDRKADVAPIAIVQSFRLLMLVTFLPSAVVLVTGGNPSVLPGQGQPAASPLGLALVLAGGLALGTVLARVGVAAPILLGTAFVSTVLHVTDIAPGAVPPVIAVAGLVLIGLFIAERFRTLEWGTVRRLVPAALGSFTLSMIVAAAFAGLASRLAGVGFADALVAFAPGGLEAMMMLALVLGLDPLYVGVHHLARFLGIGFLVPFAVAWLQRK
jgi:membrane AbrB-like protein